MDPVTQGVVGVGAAQLVASRRDKLLAALLGGLSGMAADLDVLISSSSDPLLGLEYHRHFTHALVFIPVGALLCAGLFYLVTHTLLKRGSLGFKPIYLFCFAGYATHALLDACTTYGTQLLWPFSDVRVAWNNVSVVDPLFSIPLLCLVAASVLKRSQRVAWVSAVYALSYLSFGVLQNNRAETAALSLAESRGHTAINLGVKPSFANIVVWKSVYEHNGRYYVDAIRTGASIKVYSGVSTPKLDVVKQFPWLNPQSQQAKDIERFRWFSNQHLGVDPNNPNRILDIRYSLIPNQLTGMWGITLSPTNGDDEHVQWSTMRPEGAAAWQAITQLWQMVLGR